MLDSEPVLEQLKMLAIDRDDPLIGQDNNDDYERPKGRGKWLWAGVALCVVTGATWGAYKYELGVNDLTSQVAALVKPEAETIAPVQTTTAPSEVKVPTVLSITAHVATPTIVGSGYVLSEREIGLKSEIAGRITEMPFDIGDSFAKGDVLVRLDDKAFQYELSLAEMLINRAELTVQQATLELKNTQIDADLTRKKVERGLSPKTELEQAEQQLSLREHAIVSAKSDVALATLQHAQLAEQQSYYTVEAPFDGVVVSSDVSVGDLIPSGVDGGPAGIMTLIDPSALIVQVDVAESNLGSIFAGQSGQISLDAYPGKTFDATVVAILQQVSIQKGTVAVRLRFDTPPMGVLANMSARIEFSPNT
ncbi:MAG: efflux RND transporter periplasmic adaptor subunit [Sulfitobacter sp.]